MAKVTVEAPASFFSALKTATGASTDKAAVITALQDIARPAAMGSERAKKKEVAAEQKVRTDAEAAVETAQRDRKVAENEADLAAEKILQGVK